jgi:hypothetical protein
MGRGLDSVGSGQRAFAASCEHCNEPLENINGGKFLNELSGYFLINNDSVL